MVCYVYCIQKLHIDKEEQFKISIGHDKTMICVHFYFYENSEKYKYSWLIIYCYVSYHYYEFLMWHWLETAYSIYKFDVDSGIREDINKKKREKIFLRPIRN